MALSDIETIVIVIRENRSFDHMLGYLNLEGRPVEGLKADQAWRDSYANAHAGGLFRVHRIDPASAPCSDPQHDRQSIDSQINMPPLGPTDGRLR